MKNIRSNFVKESLLDYENLAKTLKENTSSAVKDLLNEAVLETYNKMLSESDEDEDSFDVEEVEDTNDSGTEDTSNKAETTDFGNDDTEETSDTESDSLDDENNDAEETTETEISPEGDEATSITTGSNEEGDEWAEFEKYKVNDDEYDFSNAKDDEIVRVYKLLKDEDQVCVNVNNNKLDLKDNETGAEYLIDLDSLGGSNATSDDVDVDIIEDGDEGIDAESDFNNDEDEENIMTNESRIFEIALNEYDSHVGYTDNYQKKDVMTTPDMSEPGKNVNDWDAGVPKGKSKPWSSQKKSVAPFNGEKGKTVEEETELEEGGYNVGGKVQQRSVGASTVLPNTQNAKARPYNQHHVHQAGKYETEAEATNESIVRKANKIFAENKQLKSALNQFRNVLQEAAVTNVNLGQIIKLISENATTKAEKQDIIARFGKEAKTIEESKRLYSTISNELQKNATTPVNITEGKQFTANSSKMINETTIYQSKDLLNSLDLMHRIC